MSLSPRNDRIALSIVAAALAERTTAPKASSAESFQCQVSSKASICAADARPCGPLKRTL